MELVTQVQILDKAVCISLYANTFPKGINQSVLSSALGKYLGRLISLTLVRQPVSEKENSEFETALLCFKIDFVSHPACGRGVR